jgi:molecular chaperone GrpE
VTKSKHEKDEAASFTGGESANDPALILSGDPASGADAPGADAAFALEIAKLRAEKDDLLQTLVQRQADFENYRKRTERDRHEEGRRGVERLIADLIPVLDGFDRALNAHDDPAYDEYSTGMKLIHKQFWDALARHGLQRIDAAGKMFDPHVHQAIERAESTEHPDGLILDVFQDGYLFHGRVLRPAIVRVVVHPAGDEAMDTRTGNH